MTGQTWTIQEVARSSGTTSRTLRHYEHIGLLRPCATAGGGQRIYDRDGVLRLQRILVLRSLGLGLRGIARILDEDVEAVQALREHVSQLESERERLADVLGSVHSTIDALEKGEPLVTDTMFNGFDHTQFKDEVEGRWGRRAYADADAWWRALSDEDKRAHQAELDDLVAGFADASARGLDAADDEVQALAARQYDWVSIGWGGRAPSAEAFTGLGQMYVDDPRFGKTYSAGGRSFAGFVRDAMNLYAAENLR